MVAGDARHPFDLVTLAMIAAAASLAAAAPDPGSPAAIPLISFLGAFLGVTIGRLAGASREKRRELAEDAAYLGAGFGLVAYVVGLSTGLY